MVPGTVPEPSPRPVMVPEPSGTLPGRGELTGMVPGTIRPAGRPRGPGLFAKSTVLISAYFNDVGGLVGTEPPRPGSGEGFPLFASSWASAVSSPGSPLESPTGPRGALEQSSSSASSVRSPPAGCVRRSIRRRAAPLGALGYPGSWRSRSSIPFDGASTRREHVRVLDRRQSRERAGTLTGAQRRGHRAVGGSRRHSKES